MDKVIRLSLVLLLAGLFGLGLSGCTRRFYRTRADMEVDDILTEKDQFHDWQIDQYHVYPDPRARFADDTNPDCPPMPPDDPAAEEMAPNPQKPRHAGVRLIEGEGYLELLAAWDAENRAEAAAAAKKTEAAGEKPPIRAGAEPGTQGKSENVAQDKQQEQKPLAGTPPNAPATTSLSSPPGAPRPYLLKLEQTVELGLINSREYQDARENLYMAALPVATQRFSFAAQFFAFGQAVRQWAGSQTSAVPKNNWALSSNVGFSKLFSTGALLLAD